MKLLISPHKFIPCVNILKPVFHIIIVMYTCVSHHYHDAHLNFTSLLQCTPVLHIIIMHARKLYNVH